ncbi:MAG: hypothetical protein FH748_08895 [Balneolaceae bacterium]|nr:hypothetical protein [Balneolaceae bacterium]
MDSNTVIEYNSTEYQQFLKDFRSSDEKKNQLIVFAGVFSTNRNYAIEELKREVIGETLILDLSEIITPYEEESYQNIDTALEKVTPDTPLLLCKNAQQLCGAYTGFTSSTVKYATPQEKHFIKQIKALECPVLIDFENEDQLDKTIVRSADTVVLFKEPTSFFERIAWKIKQIKVHGSSLPSPRPV